MHRRLLNHGIAALLVIFLAPASGYHIQGNSVDPSGATPLGLTSGDWVIDGSQLIVCESDGESDPRNPAPAGHHGTNGLCTTGRNKVTGEDPPWIMPDRGDWTRLDICNATTWERENDASNGYQQNDCGGSSGSAGRTDTIAWVAEVGAYSCFVPTTGTLLDAVLGTLSDRDYALYYEELYAWWSYDLDGTEPGYHGHVGAFPDVTEHEFDPDDPTALVLRGSAEAHNMTTFEMATVLAAANDASSTAGDFPNNCDSSPSLTADGNQGPVMAAANVDAVVPPPPDTGLPAVVVLADDGAGGASLLLRVNPGWSCTPVTQSGTDYYVECFSSGSFDNVCLTVAVVVEGTLGTSECTGGTGITATASPLVSGAGAAVAGPSTTAFSPFRCTAHIGISTTPGWIVTCNVNDP